jgi:hypothetical protein
MSTTITTEQVFRRRQKVVAVEDLPGVPAGTVGKVYYVAGVTWVRYHVAFENGVELANVDASQLRDRKQWLADQQAEEEQRRAEEREAAHTRRREELLADLADGPRAH